MSKTILVVDDEPRIVSVIESYLGQYGYRVVKSYSGEEALAVADKEKPDLIILDIMMPLMDGYEFLRQHRKQANTPIIFLTAKVEDEDKILGLELGADDYVAKPFRPRELMARVKAVLRRGAMVEPDAGVLSIQNLVLHRDNRSLHKGDQSIDLTPSEFDLLAALMSKPGKVFSRLDLLDFIQGVRFEGYERTIDLHIKNLRAKLGDSPRQPKYIQTIYGAGYRLIGE
ncbi:MAG: response regulator transcription factor [Anaerolineales bacterium]|nr:response regulator transcription factor [Anaerolineales bacterium]